MLDVHTFVTRPVPSPPPLRDFDLEEALRGISAQLCGELSRSLTERGYPGLSPALQATLTGQVLSVVQEGNPIRSLVGETPSNPLFNQEERLET